MTPTLHPKGAEEFALPPGMLEREAYCAIRDLVRLHGFEAAREMVAQFLNEEAERKKQ